MLCFTKSQEFLLIHLKEDLLWSCFFEGDHNSLIIGLKVMRSLKGPTGSSRNVMVLTLLWFLKAFGHRPLDLRKKVNVKTSLPPCLEL